MKRETKMGLGSLRWAAVAVTALLAVGCSGSLAGGGADSMMATSASDGDHGGSVEGDLARIREATSGFRSLESAIRAGYAPTGGRCLANPPHGAMGFHHSNSRLMDDRLELERPEILVYERLPDGSYRFNGVEYIIPFSERPMDAEPPRIMGQDLKPAPSLNLWYLHVWVWQENPSGVFADWNPTVEC